MLNWEVMDEGTRFWLASRLSEGLGSGHRRCGSRAQARTGNGEGEASCARDGRSFRV
jgi:hypothetical protein